MCHQFQSVFCATRHTEKKPCGRRVTDKQKASAWHHLKKKAECSTSVFPSSFFTLPLPVKQKWRILELQNKIWNYKTKKTRSGITTKKMNESALKSGWPEFFKWQATKTVIVCVNSISKVAIAFLWQKSKKKRRGNRKCNDILKWSWSWWFEFLFVCLIFNLNLLNYELKFVDDSFDALILNKVWRQIDLASWIVCRRWIVDRLLLFW